MAPQDDLTAERAAALLSNIVGIVPMTEQQRATRVKWLVDYAKTARQEALREAKEVAKSELRNTMILASCPGQSSAAWNIMWKLDRLASEGA